MARLIAHEREEDHFFVSYAHDDSGLIIPEMNWLTDAGARLWYDDGIHVGSAWRQTLANSLLKSKGVIFFCTDKSSSSRNCLQEINFALEEAKPIFVVQLDNTPLPPELRLALGTHQLLKRSNFSEAEYKSRLLEALEVKTMFVSSVVPTVLPGRKTHLPLIAIAPYRNLSTEPALGFWLESFSDSLSGRLGQRFLRCVEGENADADYILTISGHADDNERHIRGKITNAGGEIIGVWQEDQSVSELGQKMDYLVITAAGEIAGMVINAERNRLKELPLDSLNAFEMVVCATTFGPGRRKEREEKLHILSQAMELDPAFALAPAMSAFLYGYIIVTQFSRDLEADTAKALDHARLALRLAPREPLILGWCSYAHRSVGEVDTALELAEQATRLAGSANGMWGRAGSAAAYGSGLYATLVQKNLPEEIFARMAKDPVPEDRYLEFAHALAGNYEEALVHASHVIGVMNQNFQPWVELANIQGHLGDIEGGLRSLKTAQEHYPSIDFRKFREGVRLGWGGGDHVTEALAGGVDKILDATNPESS